MQLVVALDADTKNKNLALAEKLADKDVIFKMGLRMFMQGGTKAFKQLVKLGRPVLADLKLHDIPNTMATTIGELVDIGAWGATIHTTVGEDGLNETLELCSQESQLYLFGVTVLTSMTDEQCQSVYGGKRGNRVFRYGNFGNTIIDGVVCKPSEAKHFDGKPLLTLCPGVRVDDKPVEDDDQDGRATIEEAWEIGCDYIVVGRPIYRANKPRRVVRQILERIEDLE